MYTYTCPDCGHTHALANILVCPFCMKTLADETPEMASKHIRRCTFRLNPYIYSKRGRGRPSKKEIMEEFEDDLQEYKNRRVTLIPHLEPS